MMTKPITETMRRETAKTLEKYESRCRIQYANGGVKRWCDRQLHHDGPCSGDLTGEAR